MDLHKKLEWRYATKKFSDKKVEQNKVDKIVEAINLSASSAGIQPYRLLVIENKELQKVLRESSTNPQIEEASHLLVFASFEKITLDHINDYINLIARERGTKPEELAEFKKVLELYYYEKPTQEESAAWAAKQAYLGLGTGLIAAAELEVDSTPMEGFDAAKFDEILKLKEKGLKSVVALALGYRDAANDWNANLKKVRLPINEFAIQISN